MDAEVERGCSVEEAQLAWDALVARTKQQARQRKRLVGLPPSWARRSGAVAQAQARSRRCCGTPLLRCVSPNGWPPTPCCCTVLGVAGRPALPCPCLRVQARLQKLLDSGVDPATLKTWRRKFLWFPADSKRPPYYGSWSLDRWGARPGGSPPARRGPRAGRGCAGPTAPPCSCAQHRRAPPPLPGQGRGAGL